MGFKEWIIPQNKMFFRRLDDAINNAVAASDALADLLNNYGELAARRQTIKDIEHKGDSISHDIHDALSRSFITPLDRPDIATLAKVTDDVVDAVYASANRLFLYEISKPTPEMFRFADILRRQVRELRAALGLVRNPKTRSQAMTHAIEVHRLENEADRLLNDAMAELFRGHDPIQILKLKEVLEIMEGATDRCEDLADVIADIVRKHR